MTALPLVLAVLALAATAVAATLLHRSRILRRSLDSSHRTLAETRTRLELINSIATGIRAGMDANEIIESSVRQIGEAFPGLRAAWSTVDGGLARVVHSVHPEERSAIGDMVTDLGAAVPEYFRELERGEPIAVRDVLRDARLKAVAGVFVQRGSRAILDVPVVVNGSLTALLYLDSDSVRDWSPHEISALHEAADYLALAIVDAQLHEEQTKIQTGMLHAQKLESLGVLAGGIAHDFNNLLTGILGNASLGVEEARDERCTQLFERIDRAAQRASDLTGQMLAYSGRARFEHDKVNLSELVAETATLLDASTSGVSVDYELGERMPAVEGDSGQIQQVVMNLITNAAEAMEGSCGRLRLRTGTQTAREQTVRRNLLRTDLPAARYVFVEVADEGCGMTPETRARMFDPFYTTKFTGRGLGLAAVLGIVRSHHGALLVDSEPGLGTTVRALFPASAAADRVGEAPGVESQVGPSEGTVLVIDDDPVVRRVARDVLESGGFEVVTAADGVAGVEAYARHRGEVVAVLLDLTMPDLSGDEVFHRLREVDPDVTVILSSGYSEKDAATRFQGTDLAGFIHKPYRRRDLLAAVRSATLEPAL